MKPLTDKQLAAASGHPYCADTRRCYRCNELRSSSLVTCLQAAVPLNVWHLDALTGETRELQLARWREHALPIICERADIILYRAKKKGETAQAFNDLARGMAALSTHHGGFEAFALHWCATHSPGGAVPTRRPVCPGCADTEAKRPASTPRPVVTMPSPWDSMS